MSKPQEEFKKQSYFRLLKYAFSYKFRLIVGVAAGFTAASSLFGAMLMVPSLINGIQKSIVPIEKYQEPEIKDTGKSHPPAALEVKDPQLEKQISGIRSACKKLGLPVTVGDQTIKYVPLKDNGDLSKLQKFYRIIFYFVPDLTINIKNANGLISWQFFSISAVIFLLIWIVRNLAIYINHYYMRWVGTKVIADLRNEVFKALLGQSLKFYGKMDVGQLISRCTNDTAAIESAVANTIADATRCPVEILVCVSVIIFASVKNGNYALPVLLFIGLPLTVLPILILGRKIRKIYKRAYSKIAEVVSRMHEAFTGIMVVKAYNTEKKEFNIFRDVNRKYSRSVIHALKLELLMTPLMEIVAVTAAFVFILYSISQNITLTEIAMLFIPAVMAYKPIKDLAKISTYLQRSMAAADRYFNLIDANTGIKERENPVVLDEFRNEISFNNVIFSYENGKRILDGIELKILKGHVVAVVGETGSGKTTIANLIARFYDVDSGSVTIDGIDVRDMKISSLRDHIGIVTQDAILFNDTIANNIAYGCENASAEQITQAAVQANAHQFIVDGRHSEKYETVVGEKGFKLSGGEKQRIAIARAILKNPPILILDEATSALDTVTERLVQEALNRVMENRTVFAIAHRLSTIKHANMIIVLDKGKIIESGTHDELMIKGGRYKKLHDTQFGQREDTP